MKKLVLHPVLPVFLLLGRSSGSRSSERIDGIELVMLNTLSSVAFISRERDGSLQTRHEATTFGALRFLDDVPPGQSMWAVVERVDSGGCFGETRYHVTAHIHSIKEVNDGGIGTGWSEPRGQTEVIE